MSHSLLRIVAIGGVAAVTFAAPATAFAAGHGHGHAKTHHSHKHHGKPAPARFTAVGVVTAVDTTAGTVTLADNGGSRDLHGKSVTVAVSSTTKVTRDDAPATLAQVQPGDHVAANGTRGIGNVLNAKHVNADSSPEPDASESAEPESTDSPAPQPSTSSPSTSG